MAVVLALIPLFRHCSRSFHNYETISQQVAPWLYFTNRMKIFQIWSLCFNCYKYKLKKFTIGSYGIIQLRLYRDVNKIIVVTKFHLDFVHKGLNSRMIYSLSFYFCTVIHKPAMKFNLIFLQKMFNSRTTSPELLPLYHLMVHKLAIFLTPCTIL